MTEIKVEKTEKNIKVYSKYHKDLPSRARRLGGKWSGSCWVFDIRDQDKIKDLYLDIYGEFGEETPAEYVTVRYYLTNDIERRRESIFICGRLIARAFGRDSGAQLGDNILLNDCYATSGGSVKNWYTEIHTNGENPYIEIKDVPKIKAESCIENKYEDEHIEIVDFHIDKEKLQKEKEALLKRIAEIDEILNN